MARFNDNLKAMLSQHGMTAKQLSTELGFNYQTVWSWTLGTIPRVHAMRMIARYFNVTLADLLEKDLSRPGASLRPDNTRII